MDITNYELKLLKTIDKMHTRLIHPCVSVPTVMLKHKFGDHISSAIESLYHNGMISCENESMSFFGVSYECTTMDNWKLTDKGKCYILDHKLTNTLSIIERVINFALGLISGLIIAFFTGMLNSIF